MKNKSVITRLWFHFSKRRKRQTFVLLALMIFASFGEVISIGAAIPFLSVITAPEVIFENKNFHFFKSFFNLSSPSDLILPMTIIFSLSALLSGILRLFLIFFQTKFINALAADIGVDIYRKTLYQPYSVHLSRNSSEVISSISKKVDLVVFGSILPLLL